MHKLILKHTVLFLMLDTAATFLANTQADSQAHTLFVYASYISHFQANAQADPQAHTLFVYKMLHTSATFKPTQSWPSSYLWLSLTWLLAPGPGVDEGLWGFGFPVLRSKQRLLFPVQLLAGGTIAAAVGTARPVAALACQHFHVAVVLPCGTCSRWKMGEIRTTADAAGVSVVNEFFFVFLFFNKGAVLRPVQKCHNVMVLSQVTLCDM